MTSLITSITGVWTAIMQWFADSMDVVEALFYDSTSGLTFLGTLAVIGLAIAVFMLVFNILRSFLGLRK